VEKAVPVDLEITTSPERLDEGSLEERACFGLFKICSNGVSLTEGFDTYVNRLRPGPLVSGYHVAEWLAWNWWRLRWEPQSGVADWWRAHRMTSIGEGYMWPNITIFSDGVRTALISQASSRPDARPFRYLGARPTIISSSGFEAAVDSFLRQTIDRLRVVELAETNLDRLWHELIEERSNPETVQYRKFEALLGADPDEGDEHEIRQLIDDAKAMGGEAIGELAADHSIRGALVHLDEIRMIAQSKGFDANREPLRLNSRTRLPIPVDAPAWRLGAAVAQALRDQQQLDADKISDSRLADLAGVQRRALDGDANSANVSFALTESRTTSRIVLRSKWHAGRRFELARIIGDKIMNPASGKLFPSTRARTFRQKAQRSFAAELLAPFEELIALLDGDFSEEARQEAAQHFDVSELTIRTLLVNHHRLEREDLEEDFGLVAA